MSNPNINVRLKTNIKAIEDALGLHRIHFAKKSANSFYSYRHDVNFVGRDVKASTRYLYNLGKVNGKMYTMSFGFFFYKPCQYSNRNSFLPLSDQRVTVSYGVVTEKPREKRLDGYSIINQAENYEKELCHSETFDINTAKKLFKRFKDQINDTTDRSPKNVVKLIESIFMENTHENEEKEIKDYVEFMQDDIENIKLHKEEFFVAEHNHEIAKKKRNTDVRNSDEKALVTRLEKELEKARADLRKKEDEATKEHKVNQCQHKKTSMKKELNDAAEQAKSKSDAYLNNHSLPFRYIEEIEDKIKV